VRVCYLYLLNNAPNYVKKTFYIRILKESILLFGSPEQAVVMSRIDLNPKVEIFIVDQNCKLTVECDREKTFGIHLPLSRIAYPNFLFTFKSFEEMNIWYNFFRVAQKCIPLSINQSGLDISIPPYGYLEKKNPSGIGWKKRFFVLELERSLLSYYTDLSRRFYKGGIYIPNTISPSVGRDHSFYILSKGRKYILKAPSTESQKEWIKAISNCNSIANAKDLFKTNLPDNDSVYGDVQLEDFKDDIEIDFNNGLMVSFTLMELDSNH